MNIFCQNCFEYSKLSVSLHPQLHADMVKLVDMPDLGSGAARRVGSSPIIRTKKPKRKFGLFLCFDFTLFKPIKKASQIEKLLV